MANNGGGVGGRSKAVAEIGDVARSHGCQGDFQRVDREFLCTLCVVL